jgi:hypothetical protein
MKANNASPAFLTAGRNSYYANERRSRGSHRHWRTPGFRLSPSSICAQSIGLAELASEYLISHWVPSIAQIQNPALQRLIDLDRTIICFMVSAFIVILAYCELISYSCHVLRAPWSRWAGLNPSRPAQWASKPVRFGAEINKSRTLF